MADLAHLNMDSAANGSNGNGSATDLPFGVKESVAKSNVKTRSMIEQCSGTNCIRIGLPGKLILRERKGLPKYLFS